MPTDDDYLNDPELMEAVNHFAIAELGKAIVGDTGGDTEKLRKARQAAVEICRRAGILEILQAVSADGVLRPPPPWPQTDVVPVGGSLTWLTVRIRTAHDGRVIATDERIKIKKGGKPTQDQIGAAHERGKWRLKKAIAKEATH